MALKENLKRIRIERGLSQTRLAKAAGISQQSISRLESGLDTTSKYLPRIAAALRVPVSALDPTFLNVVSSDNWATSLRAAIAEAVKAGATLDDILSELDAAFGEVVADHLRSRISALPPSFLETAAGTVGKIAGMSSNQNKSDKTNR